MKEENNKQSRKSFLKTVSISVFGTAGFFGGIPPRIAGNNKEKKLKSIKVRERAQPQKGALHCDLMVYGATSAGVMTAYTAKSYGLNVLLVEPGRHLGGLTSGGLGKTDTGGKDNYIKGLAKEFYLRIGHYYGKEEPVYRFEPHVAERMFEQYTDEVGLEVLFSRQIKNVRVHDFRIQSVALEYAGKDTDIIRIVASNFVDATYEGDLMAKAGVSFTTGREGNSTYNEKYNGVVPSRVAGGYDKSKRIREWPDVDPYKKPGIPDSGLLPEINGIGHASPGTGDDKIQAFCYRMCLTQNKKNQIPITKPEVYDPSKYELLVRLMEVEPWDSLQDGFNIATMPNGKTDWNNDGDVGFSTDYIGKNYDFPTANYAERARICKDHINYQQGLIYFVGHDSRVPIHIRKEMNNWGYCRDEFLDSNGWPHQLYIRESRRMVSDFVMTEHHCTGNQPIKDGIILGGYALDSHNCQRVVVEDRIINEGNFFITDFNPYPISYRSITPKIEEITNLIVPVCLSASHVAFGSIRMEPVFLGLGQAAGVAAYLAVDGDYKVQEIKASAIRKELRDNPLPNRKVSRRYSKGLHFK